MFDYIGIDWGEKVCGLAFGDSTTRLVIPANFEILQIDILRILQTEVTKRKTTTIVIGIPFNFRGQKTRVTTRVEHFEMQLKRAFPNIQVATMNERGTTQDSIKKLNKYYKYQLDNQSAAEILSLYFLRNKAK